MRASKLRSYNPFMTPRWRWNRAEELVADGQSPPPDEDAAVLKAVEFLRGLKTAGRQRSSVTWSREFRAIQNARELFRGDVVRRWEVEARLLSGQSDNEIASRLRIAPHEVDLYERLFFDVRESLRAHDWIFGKAIGWPRPGQSDQELGRLWKSVGYFGGPSVLDWMIVLFRHVWKPGSPATVDVYLGAKVRLPLEVQAFVAGYGLPDSPSHDGAACVLHAMIQALERGPNENVRNRLRREAQVETIRTYHDPAGVLKTAVQRGRKPTAKSSGASKTPSSPARKNKESQPANPPVSTPVPEHRS